MAKKRLTKKEILIGKIKNIIQQDGEFKDSDVNMSEDLYKSLFGHHDKKTQLGEVFKIKEVKKTGVLFEFYVNGKCTDDNIVTYEELDTKTLDGILYLAEDWSVICYKTMKRASD